MTQIIFSPCKEMNQINGENKFKPTHETKNIITQLQKLSQPDICKLFKVSDDKAQEVFQYYQDLQSPKASPAYQVYQGLSYRQIQWQEIDLSYAQEHLRILSALYGPIGPLEPIHPYRLDFTTTIKVKSKSLKNLWKPIINQTFKGQTVINLASKEFSSLITDPSIQLINFEFFQDTDLKKKAPTATCKKLRGSLVNHLLTHQDTSDACIKSYTCDGYQFAQLNEENMTYYYTK